MLCWVCVLRLGIARLGLRVASANCGGGVRAMGEGARPMRATTPPRPEASGTFANTRDRSRRMDGTRAPHLARASTGQGEAARASFAALGEGRVRGRRDVVSRKRTSAASSSRSCALARHQLVGTGALWVWGMEMRGCGLDCVCKARPGGSATRLALVDGARACACGACRQGSGGRRGSKGAARRNRALSRARCTTARPRGHPLHHHHHHHHHHNTPPVRDRARARQRNPATRRSASGGGWARAPSLPRPAPATHDVLRPGQPDPGVYQAVVRAQQRRRRPVGSCGGRRRQRQRRRQRRWRAAAAAAQHGRRRRRRPRLARGKGPLRHRAGRNTRAGLVQPLHGARQLRW